MDKRVPDTRALWAAAMPIKMARLHFAPLALLSELECTSAVNFADMVFSAGKDSKTDREFMPKLGELAKIGTTQTVKRQAILAQIDQHFSDMIMKGTLRCFAFEFPRTFTAQPVEMLSSHWTARPDWAKGEFRANGLHLIELRVLTADNTVTPTLTALAPSQGRPAFMNEIREAYEALCATNSMVVKPLSQGIHQIRSWIVENRPNSKAAQSLLRDDTIRKALNFLMKA